MSGEERRHQRRAWWPPRYVIRRRLFGAILVVSLVTPVYILDRVTGATPDLSGLYLLPVVLVAYWLGVLPGLAVAGIVMMAELAAHPGIHTTTIIVHALTHGTTYAFVAFVTARLRSQLSMIRELEGRRNYELELARHLHESAREGYRPSGHLGFDVATRLNPARELGGDLVVVRESVGGLFICIADISGKGVPAALFSALLQDTVNNALLGTDDPEEVVVKVNARMYDALPAEMFVTMFCGLLSEDVFHFVNAGHEPGLIRREEDVSSIELDSESGMPVGVRKDLRIPEGEVCLKAGDVLLLFTDGITDSTGFRRDAQNVRRFFESQRWPNAEAAAEALIAEAQRGGQAQPDDMSIVVVRVPAV